MVLLSLHGAGIHRLRAHSISILQLTPRKSCTSGRSSHEEEDGSAWVTKCWASNHDHYWVKLFALDASRVCNPHSAEPSWGVKRPPHEFKVGRKVSNLGQNPSVALSLSRMMRSPQPAACNADVVGNDDPLLVKQNQENCLVNSPRNSQAGRLAVSENSPAGKKRAGGGGGGPSYRLSVASLDIASGDSEVSPQSADGECGGGCGEEASASALASDEGDESQSTGEDGTRNTGHEQRTPSSRVAVIGAGAAGLVAARELVREGHEVVIFEQRQEVGGVWQYDPRVESDCLGTDPNRTRVHSSMYQSLRTNLAREIMGFLDYPFLAKEDGQGRDDRRFPTHREVALYLEEFSEDYDLVGLMRFGVKVESVGLEELKGGDTRRRWVVEFRKSRDSKTVGESHVDMECLHDGTGMEFFDAVVVCTGHYSEPRIAHIPGAWQLPPQDVLEVEHRECSKTGHSPYPLDQVVVIIGSANSAADISKEVALVAKEVHLCARKWTSSEHSTEGKGPESNLWEHPMVERACPDGTVEFQDGTSAVADIILHCTGYLYSFPFLDAKDYISVDDNRVDALYKHIFPPALAPTLSFVGIPFKVVPFPIMELQSRWIARLLSGKSSLPLKSEMMADVKNHYEQLEANHVPKRYTHSCDANRLEYVQWLAEQSGHEPVETWRHEIYLSASKYKMQNLQNAYTYRDQWEDQQWLEVAMTSLKKIKVPSKVHSQK